MVSGIKFEINSTQHDDLNVKKFDQTDQTYPTGKNSWEILLPLYEAAWVVLFYEQKNCW